MPMTFFAHLRRYAAATVATLVLAACGGGGSDSPASSTLPPGTSAATTFPLAAAMVKLLKEGKSTPFSITATGSGNGQTAALTGSGTSFESNSAGTFNGAAALVKTIRVTGTLEARGVKTPLPDTITTQYFDANYKPLGALSQFGYCVYSAQTALPATVRIGDTGTYHSSTCYTNSTKTTLLDTSTVSYTVESATDTTAIFKLVFKSATASASIAPVTVNYVVSTNGSLTRGDSPVSLTASGVTIDLVLKFL